MIVEFSVANFRSIKEMQTISFAATKLDSSPDNAEVDKNNVVEEGGMRLLKTVGIYGPNASGKSNVIRAFEHFLEFLKIQPGPQSRLQYLYQPHFFQDNPEESECFFQIVFIMEGKKYRYGFTVRKSIIASEWLYGTLNKNMVPFFIRTESKEEIDIRDSFQEAKETPSLEQKHNSFLVHVASFKKALAYKIFNYFSLGFFYRYTYSGLDLFRYSTISLLQDPPKKAWVLEFLSKFNLNLSDILVDTEQKNDLLNPIPQDKIVLCKYHIDNNGIVSETKLNLANTESAGTQKLFDLAGTIILSLILGRCYIIDELDSNFHPALLIKLIGMFNDPKINTGNAQLLFTTHDTNLLDPSIMRRDQFYFTEKNEQEATRLYSLADLKGIRNDADFARQYLAGFYGALPVLDNYTEKAAPHE